MQIAPQRTHRFFRWTDYKAQIAANKLNIQYSEHDGLYKIWGYNGADAMLSEIYLGDVPYAVVAAGYSQVQNDLDKTDFETNFMPSSNKKLENDVITVFERDDKDLKLAKGRASVNPATNKATISVCVAGTPGSGDGRWILGGYAFVDTYHADDYAICYVEDTDRMIAWQIALAMNPGATAPLDDADVIAMGDYPMYPIVKCYYDEELDVPQQGWWTWPVVMGNSIPPQGECEVEPIGGYGFLPAGFYLVIEFFRTISTGDVKVCYYWGKSSVQS